ncbi:MULTISPECIES: heat-inducible transcriptional repressor HrcA [Desulfosporosinus]|uniref:Heat-inducible transcription repressor HrcA n=1 Tax=Desulfosporosinus lacus DSM 15449 TaxID=1121420 RepID=A0A1M5VBY1_9FIRM|nr:MULTISPECIES: heat-inducible transcriptional repressor HrcA [Desulfosporosinus]MCO1600855.1 heat-inducible transcriptional repressor HrcA [Desulfosporosinus nitroreducens]MDA8220631.1 heat-inducible transcriptional repressor HrcA [Desulfitobacterium hafniense]SHH72706.1 heat-inducible transcription repressor HrcA [Desulfosporosinus lacus DSM 15449]
MQMDERKRKILRAIVQDYIATAEPIGSRTIARKFDLGVSSATIRNEMADLEDLGFIEQPYTSAGRIPSDAGYRYFVDCLMDPQVLNPEDMEIIERESTKRINELQEVIAHTSKLLSELTNLTSLVLGPHKGKSTFGKMHFLPYQPGQVIMVIVKENGVVENHIIDVGENLTAEELQQVAGVFNQKMRGYSIGQVKRSMLHEIYSELSRQRLLIDNALDMLRAILDDNEEEERIHLGGTLNMLNQPEFKDLSKVKTLFKVFEENESLKKVLTPRQEGLNVTIGGENTLKEFRDCSIISATYKVNGLMIGAVGVLGPTRMDYAKVIAIVDFMTRSLTEVLTKRRR